jgi:hypothetical protein
MMFLEEIYGHFIELKAFVWNVAVVRVGKRWEFK